MTVTIRVPVARPTIRRPEGDPAGCDDLARTLYTTAARFEEFSDEAQQLRDLSGGWSGAAYDAYRAASARASGEHSRMSTSVRRVARAVTSYADTLRDHVRDWEDLVDRRRTLDADRADLVARIDATTHATEADIAELRAQAGHLDGRYDALVADHERLHREVRANEELLVQAFRAADQLDEGLAADGGIPDSTRALLQRPGAPGTGGSPEQARAWWDGLSGAEREAVVAACPERVGSADGLPADARDQANRVLLDDDLARLQAKEDDGTISPTEWTILANAEETRQALGDADSFVDPITGDRPGGRLWLYDPAAFDGDGRVAVSIGDPDTAEDVSVQVPGITTEHVDVVNGTGEAMNLYESARYAGDGSSVATMFWLGYDTPEGPVDVDTVSRGRAEDGGERLADAVDGLRASRTGDPAHLTVIGHSYGSTTTSYAATDHDLGADDVALIGSPGAGPADEASDFGVGEEHVFVGRNSDDAVAFFGDEGAYHNPGGLGVDPSSEGFDANRFEAESVHRNGWRDIGNHSHYYEHDSESLYNLGRIVDGQVGDVNTADHSHDPWWRWADDPEKDRDVTSDLPGRSDTTAQ